ncbi:MAG: amino acid ABC transporter substrate-binding protein [Deltaproteobacteria bacterium]|nr:amino acid ABC transporter substrate-binding protein [Deltaproteobacteria bacterium]
MRRQMVIALALGLIGLMVTAGPALAQKTEIRIGMTNSFSGPLAQSATKVWQGVLAWQLYQNAQGGIFVKDLGKKLPVKVIYYDDETNRQNLIRFYERLGATDNVDFFFGPFGSGQTHIVAAMSDKYKKLMIATTASAPIIFAQGNKYIIQAVMNTKEFGRPYLDMLAKVDPQHKRLAFVWEDHLFPKSVKEEIAPLAKEYGFQIVFDDKFPFGAKDITPLLTRLKQANPDHVYLLANIPGGILGLRQMSELKVNVRSVGLLDNGMVYYRDALGGPILDGVLGPVEWDISVRHNFNYGPNNDEFIRFHERAAKEIKFADPKYDNHTPAGFNSGLLLAKAIETAGTLQAEKVREVYCTMTVVTLVGPQAWYCDNGMMKEAARGGFPTIVTQWRRDGSTVTVWPVPPGDTRLLRVPKAQW